MIIEQSQEWNPSELVVNFIDIENTLYSIDRAILCKIMRNYGILEKSVTLTRQMYESYS